MSTRVSHEERIQFTTRRIAKTLAWIGGIVTVGCALLIRDQPGPNHGGDTPKFWTTGRGKGVLNAHDPDWRKLLAATVHLELPDKPAAAYTQFQKWLAKPSLQTELAALALNTAVAPAM